MDRSPEKSALLSTKVQSLEAKTANPRQQFAHEAVTTNPIFRQLKAFSSQSTLENGSNSAGFPSPEVGIARNSEFISPLQAQYYPPTVPSAAIPMSLPYGMLAGQGMDPRALSAGNLPYPYGNPMIYFQNFAGYGQAQRSKNSEETSGSNKCSNPSSQLRSADTLARSTKEPLRTESVIKTVTDKQDTLKKQSDVDKRSSAETQGSSVPLRYPDRGKGSEVRNSDDGRTKGPPSRDMSLRDAPGNEDVPRRDKQSIATEYDRTRDKISKAKGFEHLAVDSNGNKKPTNGLASARLVENGPVSSSSYEKGYTSEARSSPYPANEPPTLVPYHNTLPPKTSANTTHSNIPSTMPKLTPIAPRISNGSPLTVAHSSEAEHKSSSYAAWRPSYTHLSNSVPAMTSHGGTVSWTANYPGVKQAPGDKAEENSWRAKQPPREERDQNWTGAYENAQKHSARNFYPMQPWDRQSCYGTLPSQLRAIGVTDKGFGGKDIEEDSRDVSRDSMTSAEHLQSKLPKAPYKFGSGQSSLRKENDFGGGKIPIGTSNDEYQRSQPFMSRNEKSVVGEYVNYNNKSEDGKGSNFVVVNSKGGSFRLSVERREGNQKYPKHEVVKTSRMEENRPSSGYYNSHDSRDLNDPSLVGIPRSELKSEKEKEGVDIARTVDYTRTKDQSSYKEHAGRKPDSRELAAVGDGKKNNDRNNNSTSMSGFPFFKYSAGPNGEQTRYGERGGGAVRDNKVFVPPNATIEMYEKREQEMEKNGFRKSDIASAFSRNLVESNRLSNPAEEVVKRTEERRNIPKQDDMKSKLPTGRFESEKRGESEEISADNSDERSRQLSRESASPDKRAQLRFQQSSDKVVVSSAAGDVRQRRLSSPLSEQRNTTAPSTAYGASVAPGPQSRIAANGGSEGVSRESTMESGMSGLGNQAAAQFPRMDGGAFPNPYFASMLAAPQGMPEAPFLVLDPSIYSAMYRTHMMEAAAPGMFPHGALAADPVAASFMVLHPESYVPVVAAENAAFMMDPRFHGMWPPWDEAQWQQFCQMMPAYQQQQLQQQLKQQQQQQQQQLHERSKQELLFSKQASQFPFSAYPFYYGDKHFDPQRKDESQDGKSASQQQKIRDVKQEQPESQSKEPAPRPKPEIIAPQEHAPRRPASRESESHVIGQQQETSNPREEKKIYDSRQLKEAHQKLTEKYRVVQEQIDAQGQFAKQIKDYLSRDPYSHFPFPRSQPSFLRDFPKVNLTVPVTTTSSRTPEVNRDSASPKTVSAAVTLSNLEKGRGEESQWAVRGTPPIKTDQNGVLDRVKSPRPHPSAEAVITKEIVETPRRLEAQPNLVGERIVSRETRDMFAGQIPSQFPQKLMAHETISSERLVNEKPDLDSERGRLEDSYRAHDRELPASYNEITRNVSKEDMTTNLETRLSRREHSQGVDSYEEMNSFAKTDYDRGDRGPYLTEVTFRESLDPLEDNRGNLRALMTREKISPSRQLDSDSEFEDDDFNTKCELRRIASSFVPLQTDIENKENSTIFSLRPFRSEADRKKIRENIDRRRSMAKRRNSKDRAMVSSRRKDLRSPTTILNSVTSAISDVAGVESVEKEMRMKLAELQKKYREKMRELARLQPKYGAEDGKSTPIKRGPGRPRKRKYFGAGSKGDKSSPVPTGGYNKEGEEHQSVIEAHSPDNAGPSDTESLVSKDSEPPKKKKKKTKQKSSAERDGRGSAPPSRGLSPTEFPDFPAPTGKKKKSRKPAAADEEPDLMLPKNKSANLKKKESGAGKRRKGSPTNDTVNQKSISQLSNAAGVPSPKELDHSADFTEPKTLTKNTKAKKPKPKKRARPKLTIETPEVYEDDRTEEELPPDSADTPCETPGGPSPNKGKKSRGAKKKRKSTITTPPKTKFEFPDVTSHDESFSENSSVSPNDIAKEVAAIAARKQLETAQKNNKEASSDVDDEVFASNHDERDGLSLLAFASVDKTAKRRRSDAPSPSEDSSLKKRGRPKKPSESPTFDSEAPVTPKKKKKKKIAVDQESTKELKKKKKKKKKDTLPKEESFEEKLEEQPQDEQIESYEPQDEFEKKLPESSSAAMDSEQDEEVFGSNTEINKEARTAMLDSSPPREGDDIKGSTPPFVSDSWQPRRSERIFINSSVTTNSSSSPLSPVGKGSEFSYTKKVKKTSGIKGKTSRSGSQGEEELGENDVTQKSKTKTKKKKGPGKGKKRSSSMTADFEDYEPLKVSRRARSKARQTYDFDDGDEEEGDDLPEDEETQEEGETDIEISVTDKVSTEERADSLQVALVENAGDGKPKVQEERMETDENNDDELDAEMKEDQEAEEGNSWKENKHGEVVDRTEEKKRVEEVVKDNEGKEFEETTLLERPISPADERFRFLVDELVEGTKLLLPVDFKFYPGRISTFNEPDLFGVILDGERGRRPHWRSTEQLLLEAVKDIQPPGPEFLSIGTRVCAHWSPQYRCFYPGTVTEAPPDEKEVDGKIWIEFDDGDSGFFQLNEIKRIRPDFPVEEVVPAPPQPEKRPRSSSLGAAQAMALKDASSRRLKAEENTSEFSSGNESSGEVYAKRRRLRGKRKSKDDSWLVSKRSENNAVAKESGATRGGSFKGRTKDLEKSDSEIVGSASKVKDKSQSGGDSKESKVADALKQKVNRTRGKTETKGESKEAAKTAESTKNDLASVASAELKESEKEIHSSHSSLKAEGYENNTKQSADKMADNTAESSDQGEDSEAASDAETSKQEKGSRAGAKGSSRTSEMDLRKRSLNLSLNSSFRSSRTEGESPTRDALLTSQDEDSESYSDTFDESPLVENKPFQPRLGRRRRSELDRLQVDMKFSGPLWQWSGRGSQNKRKGKGKKTFYKAIARGDETICVNDCAVFMSNPTKNLNLPYVGKIENMWEGCGGNMVVRVKWFYHPEETKPGRRPTDGKQSLYRSTHVDENDVQTISHKCEVLTPEEFKRRSQSLDTPGTRTSLTDRVFCCIGSYDPNTETLQAEL